MYQPCVIRAEIGEDLSLHEQPHVHLLFYLNKSNHRPPYQDQYYKSSCFTNTVAKRSVI